MGISKMGTRYDWCPIISHARTEIPPTKMWTGKHLFCAKRTNIRLRWLCSRPLNIGFAQESTTASGLGKMTFPVVTARKCLSMEFILKDALMAGLKSWSEITRQHVSEIRGEIFEILERKPTPLAREADEIERISFFLAASWIDVEAL